MVAVFYDVALGFRQIGEFNLRLDVRRPGSLNQLVQKFADRLLWTKTCDRSGDKGLETRL